MEVAKNRAGGARNPWWLHPHTCPNLTHSDLPMMKELEGMGEDREQHGERQIESSESSVQWRDVGPPGRGPGLGERIHRDLLMGLREETGPYWTDNATHLKFP